MTNEPRVTEHDVALAVVAYLTSKPGGRREASFKELTFMLPGAWLTLNPADREWQRHRKGEQKWHAMLRNIGAHASQPGNAIHDGLLVKRRDGGYAIGPVQSTTVPDEPTRDFVSHETGAR